MFQRNRWVLLILVIFVFVAISFAWAKPHVSDAQAYTVTVSEYAVDDNSYVAELFLVDFGTMQIDREGTLVLMGETKATIESGSSSGGWELTVQILGDGTAAYSLTVSRGEQVLSTQQGNLTITRK